MIVRPAIATDRGTWGALYAAYADFYGVDQTEAMRARVWDWIQDSNHEVNALVIEGDDGLVGFAHVREFARPLAASTGLFLDDLFVTPAARGSGAAQALLLAVKVFASEQGASVVRWITAEDNTRARTLYDRNAKATEWVTYDMDV